MQNRLMNDLPPEICKCDKNCSDQCLDDVYNSGYEEGWIDCWKFLQSFFGTAPADK